MHSVAASPCGFIGSRNDDIMGYWGIGMHFAVSKKEKRPKFSFKIYPGQLLKIYGCQITDSKIVTDKLVKFDLDSIAGRLSFFAISHLEASHRFFSKHLSARFRVPNGYRIANVIRPGIKSDNRPHPHRYCS